MDNNDSFICQKWSGSFSLYKYSVTTSYSYRESFKSNPSRLRDSSSHFAKDAFQLSEDQVVVLSSLVSDIVLNNRAIALGAGDGKDINTFLAVILCADISGFTALSEQLAEVGDNGAYRLTAIINSILGSIVAVIYAYGGDVWKFSGDAILATWKVGINENYGVVTYRAVLCALQIQKKYGQWKTEYNSILRVKIGMSSGCVVWSIVGYQFSKRAILVGSPIKEQIEALKRCLSGEVVITSSVWSQLNPMYCVYQILDDGKFIKISHLYDQSEIERNLAAPGSMDYKAIRRFSNLEINDPLYNTLLTYIQSPVSQQLQANLQLEHLTELRMLTIVFVNLLPQQLLTLELIAVVNQAYVVIHKLVKKVGGIVANVSLFDKDIMLILIFGKKGFSSELRATSSLLCAYDVREACINLKGIKQVSAGVATGVCFCGVVGHPQRREWTVMGSTVNKAARLMTIYPGRVACDEATRKDAELHPAHFTELVYQPLKGFSNKEAFYEFTSDKRINLKQKCAGGLLPLLDRNDEMRICREALITLKPDNDLDTFLITGPSQIGKSRLLDEIIINAESFGLAPEVLGLRIGHSMLPFTAAVHILCQLFHISKELVERDLKHFLNSLLFDHIDISDLAHIDELFNNQITPDCVSRTLKRLFVLAFKVGVKSSVIVIDDVHFCDWASRELLIALIESKSKLLFLTLDSRHSPMENVRIMELKPVLNYVIPAMACQFVNAAAIHDEIVDFLITRQLGNPGDCQSQLKASIENQFIQVIDVDPENTNQSDLIIAKQQLLHPVVSCVPSFQPLPPPKPFVDYRWPSIDEFNYRDHLEILAAVGKRVHQRGLSKHSEKQPHATSDMRLSSWSEISQYVKNVLKYNATMDFDKDKDSHVFGCYVEQREHCTRVFPCDIPVCDVMIEESVEIFEKRLKPSIDVRPVNTQSESDSSAMLEYDITEPIVKKFVPRKSHSFDPYILSVVRQSYTIKALVLMPNTDINDCAQPQSYVNLITIFDSLGPFEQLLLKCGAVIGSAFNRPMLDYVLQNTNYFLISKTIARLFDQNILKCSLVVESSPHSGTKCACQKSFKIVANLSIPRYGYCGKPSFLHPPLRGIVYDIIPPNVKKVFHQRAIEYLVSKSNYCVSCSTQLNSDQYLEFLSSDFNHRKNANDFLPSRKYSENLSFFLSTVSEMPFSSFKKCTCVYLQSDTCSQIIQQCDNSGLQETALKFRINYAGLQIYLGLIDEALELTNQALRGMQTISMPNKEKKQLLIELKYLRGKIFMKSGDLDSAVDSISETLNLPISSRMWNQIEKVQHYFFWRIPRSKLAIRSLNLLTKIYILRGDWSKARQASKAAFKMLTVLQIPAELCKAYTNLVDITLSQHGAKFCRLFEDYRIISSSLSVLPIKSFAETITFGRVVHALYLIRCVGAGDLNAGSYLLDILSKVSSTAPQSEGIDVHLTLEHIYVSMLRGNLAQTTRAILKFHDTDKILYHALCLDFARMTGFWIQKPQTSREYLISVLVSQEKYTDSHMFYRSMLSLALWLFWTNQPDVSNIISNITVAKKPAVVRSVSDCLVRLMELELLILEEYFTPEISLSKGQDLQDWFSTLGVMAENLQLLETPLLLLQTYETYRKRKTRRVQQLLSKAENSAKKLQSELYLQRIASSVQDWINDTRVPQTEEMCHNFSEWPCPNWASVMLKLP